MQTKAHNILPTIGFNVEVFKHERFVAYISICRVNYFLPVVSPSLFGTCQVREDTATSGNITMSEF